MFIDKLDDIVNKYSNISYSIIKIKPVYVKSNTSSKEINEKDPKFKLGNIVRISKYQNIFTKSNVPNCSAEVFVIKKVQNTESWTYIISHLKGREIVGAFCEKEMQKTNQKELKVEKVIKRKSNKLYVKWKGYDSSFNSWIDIKDIL